MSDFLADAIAHISDPDDGLGDYLTQAIAHISDDEPTWDDIRARYRPMARVVTTDSILLFVPEMAFFGGWSGFREARKDAINWLVGHRAEVDGAHAVADSFELATTPLYYLRHGKVPGLPPTVYLNAAIEDERLYNLAFRLAHSSR